MYGIKKMVQCANMAKFGKHISDIHPTSFSVIKVAKSTLGRAFMGYGRCK